MRGLILTLVALTVAVAALPTPAAAEVEQAVIGILGGMQCSL